MRFLHSGAAAFVYLLAVCITTYLKADHFTVGYKGSIIRATETNQKKTFISDASTTTDDDLMSDPTLFFGSSSPSIPKSPPPAEPKAKERWGHPSAHSTNGNGHIMEEQIEEENENDREDDEIESSEEEDNQYDQGPTEKISNAGQGGVYSMTSLSSTNVFYLTKGGNLMERYFNG